jgi:2-dehydro-3-deoxygalactonokinase
MSAALIAIDWGTTNRRVFVLDRNGHILHHHRDDRGVLTIAPDQFVAEVASIRATSGDQPMLLAGMVGSARGWVNVPYRPCPADLDDLGRHLHWVEPSRTAIIPGLFDPAGDVMRGEEVQMLGAVAAGLAPANGLLCQPGTHCKWGRVFAGKLQSFSTAMTGELFALLKGQSLLADFLTGPVDDGPAFRAGVEAGMTERLTTALFRVRASALLGRRSTDDSAAFTSGLLIGHDVSGARLANEQSVYIIGDAPLDQLYATAVTMAGATPHIIASDRAFVAGITEIWRASRHD